MCLYFLSGVGIVNLMINVFVVVLFFFFKQKTAYEMRISDWSSDVCSSDLMSCVLSGGRLRAPAGDLLHGDGGHRLLVELAGGGDGHRLDQHQMFRDRKSVV